MFFCILFLSYMSFHYISISEKEITPCFLGICTDNNYDRLKTLHRMGVKHMCLKKDSIFDAQTRINENQFQSVFHGILDS